MTTGQSKKVFVGVVAMQQVVAMADDPDKFPFAVIIAVMAIAYTVKQTVLDWRSNGKEKGE